MSFSKQMEEAESEISNEDDMFVDAESHITENNNTVNTKTDTSEDKVSAVVVDSDKDRTAVVNKESSVTATDNKEPIDNNETKVKDLEKIESMDKENKIDKTISLCPCRHILVSVHSTHCGICDQELGPIKQLQQQLVELKDTKQYLQTQIEETNSVYHSYVRQYKTLSSQYEKRKEQVMTTTQHIESLKKDIAIVETKHKDEIAHSIAIEQSKLGVETELDDLGKKLFEEANEMVQQEKEKKLKIQREHDHVKKQLEEAEEELKGVETELKELRDKMTVQEEEHVTSTHENFMLRAQLDMATVLHQRSPVEIQLTGEKDTLLIDEFKQAVHALKSISFSKVSSASFMKQLIKVEIEPCLRLGPRMNYKRLIEPIIQKTCLFEACPYWFIKNEIMLQQQQKTTATPKKSSLWDRFTSSNSSVSDDINASPSDQLRCYACHKTLEINELKDDQDIQETVWKFKMSYLDQWNLIDRFCKDRIQSVIHFYGFLRKLKTMNEYELSLSIIPLYEEYSRLQLQMLLSRMGVLPTLLNDFKLK